MADVDPVAAALARIRHRADGDDSRVLLAAVEAALAAHPLDVLVPYWQPCAVHWAQREEFGGPWQRQPFASRAEAGCPNCRLVEYLGCDGCRNEEGHPSRPEECPTRTGITTALLGEEKPSG